MPIQQALAEKLHDPKVFALINLDIQRRFTSGHALGALRELLPVCAHGQHGLVAAWAVSEADGR